MINMLNKAKVLKELELHADRIFLDISAEYAMAQRAWDSIRQDPNLLQKLASSSSALTFPVWHTELDKIYSVEPKTDTYAIVGIDGSQIYPDKHQGTTCSLINIGLVSILYGSNAANPVTFHAEPHLMVDQEDAFMHHSVDAVNCRRQELELSSAYDWFIKNRERYVDFESCTLDDGSLIFWHLESKEPVIKHRYLTCYLLLLQQMYEVGMLVAGYISMPKSRDLVNILRAQLGDFKSAIIASSNHLEHIVDVQVASFFLQPYTRSTVFQSTQAITASYPVAVRPYFFYLHVGREIARIEIPAWIALDEVLLDRVSRLILDQAIKGNGYPIALAEAHEQAVIKGPDREFFYHLIQKQSIEKQKRLNVSLKSLKKRGIGI